jgi:heme exporter protein C
MSPEVLVRKRVIDPFLIVALLGVVGIYVLAIGFTPPDAQQGMMQKILYVHPPSAVGAYVAFTIAALMSALYLWQRDERSDRMAEAAGEVALLFFTVVIITGPIWAKPAWNTWWAWWDVRLMGSLFLWFIGIGTMIARRTLDDASTRARYAAVLSILGALLIPFIHLSVYLFPTMHPDPVMLKPPGNQSLSNEMERTLGLAFVAFSLLSIAFIRARYALGAQRLALAVVEDDR